MPLEDKRRQLILKGVLLGRRRGRDVVLLDVLLDPLELLLNLVLKDFVDDGGDVVLTVLKTENSFGQCLDDVRGSLSPGQTFLRGHDVPHIGEAGDDLLAGFQVVRSEGGELGRAVSSLSRQPRLSTGLRSRSIGEETQSKLMTHLSLQQTLLAQRISNRLEALETLPDVVQPGPNLLGNAAGEEAGVDPPLHVLALGGHQEHQHQHLLHGHRGDL